MVTLKPGLESLKVIGTDADRSATYDFLLTFHSNHEPISYRFRDKRDFSRKSQKNFHRRIFCAPAEGIGYRRSESKKLDAVPRKKFDDIFSRLDAMHQRVSRTYRRTDTGRQQRQRLRIASRGKTDQQSTN